MNKTSKTFAKCILGIAVATAAVFLFAAIPEAGAPAVEFGDSQGTLDTFKKSGNSILPRDSDADFSVGGTASSTADLTLDPGNDTFHIRFLNCTANVNGGALTADANGRITCTDDDGGGSSGSTFSGLDVDAGGTAVKLTSISFAASHFDFSNTASQGYLFLDWGAGGPASLSQAETITGNWVNTANPWADNEVSDTLTVGSGGAVDDGALSANVAHLNVAETIGSNWVNTANPWANNEVADDITAGTAAALAADGANCSAGQYPLGVDAAGAVQSCTADDDVPEVGDFSNLVGGAGIDNNSGTLDFDATELDALTFSNGGQAALAYTFNLSGTDPVLNAVSGGFSLTGFASVSGNLELVGMASISATTGGVLVTATGLPSPRQAIHIYTPAATVARLAVQSATTFMSFGADNSSGPFYLWNSTQALRFATGSDTNGSGFSERFRIASDGSVGINDTTPIEAKFVVGGSEYIAGESIITGALNVGHTASVAYSRFGSTTTGHSLDAANDLIIGDDFEVDDDAFFDGDTTIGILLGAVDAGGATSFELPNGSGPTVNAEGETAIDTDGFGQLVYYASSSEHVLTDEKQLSLNIASNSFNIWSSRELMYLWRGITIKHMTCEVSSATSVVINFEDGAGNNLDSLTCGTTRVSDDGSIANATLTKGESLVLERGAVTSTPDYVNITITYVETRE